MSWGRWTASASHPTTLQTNLSDGSQALTYNNAVVLFYSAASPVNPVYSGTRNFYTTSNFVAVGSQYASIENVSGNLNINFDNGAVAGKLQLDAQACPNTAACATSDEIWKGDIQGTYNAGKLTAEIDAGEISIVSAGGAYQGSAGGHMYATMNPRTFSGTLNGAFTGNGASGLILDFDLSENGNVTNYIAGVSLLDRAEYGFGIIVNGASRGLIVGESPIIRGSGAFVANDYFVLRSHNAILDNDSLENKIGGFDVSWGKWSANSDEPDYLGELELLSNHPSTFHSISSDMIFVSVVPTAINNLQGSHRFVSQSDYLVKTNFGTVTGVSGGFNVDFSDNEVYNGFLHVSVDNDGDAYRWKINDFSGVIHNGALVEDNSADHLQVTGYIYNDTAGQQEDTISGTLNGVFTGAQGNGFVLGFDFTSTYDYLSGVSLFKQASPALNQSETSQLDKFGFLLVGLTAVDGNDVLGNRLAIAGSVIDNNNNSDAIPNGASQVVIQNDSDDPLVSSTEPEYVARNNTAAVDNVTINVAGLGINWGKWSVSNDETIKIQTQYDDSSKFELLSTDALFANFRVSNLTDISGTRTYTGSDVNTYSRVAAGEFIDNSYIAISELRSIFDVNFSTGNVTNGGLVICLGGTGCSNNTEKWEVNYEGTLTSGVLTVSEGEFTGTINNDSSRQIEGYITGAFVGGTAQGFVGGFTLAEEGSPEKFTSATYLLKTDTLLTAAELTGLVNGQYGLLATSADNTASGAVNGVFGGRTFGGISAGNPIIGDYQVGNSTTLPLAFNDFPPQKQLRLGDAEVPSTPETPGFSVTWGAWLADADDAIERRVRGDGTVTSAYLPQTSYWFVATPSINTEASGRYSYSSLVDYQVGTSSGTYGKVNHFGFSVVLETGAITNGHLSVSTDDY
ncbi:MAG: hypothetical protein Q8L60_04175, partial [Gammaproteobacteria bacterium]|nr:hypothetical protein [Gammaproteobacteria bacterium]